ncbi:MAG TPA: DUF333 domain-containing protein [Anaerolineales bacterium]|nr:DUF333 domain-containing protein [Anaerolineales bacterium]
MQSDLPKGIHNIKFKVALCLIVSVFTLSLSGCQSINLTDLEEILASNDIAIPVAAFCEQNGGQVQQRIDATGEQFDVCVFSDGSECSQQAFQDGECGPGKYFGSQAPDDITAIAAPHCEQNGGTWQLRYNVQNQPYGACVFEDSSECEGGSFYRGECRPGQNFATPGPHGPQGPNQTPAEAIPFCAQNGGNWQARQNEQGGEYGVCVFDDKSECEGGAFYRGECRPGQYFAAPGPKGPQGPANLANPASQHCEQNGGTIQIRSDSAGGQYGVCVFADGTQCEEWAFYRGECSPGNAAPPGGTGNQHTYTNSTLGFSLDAPAGWTVWEAPNMVQFQYQAYTLYIGYWPANQNPPQLRTGMPAGDLKDAGQFNMAGSLFQKRYLVQQGNVRMVDFGHGLSFGPIQLSIWLDGPQGQGNNQAGEIPAEIIAQAEAILSSLTFQP